MKPTRLILIALVAIATIWGCKKDVVDNTPAPSPSPTPTSSEPMFRQYFADNVADATQTFTVNAVTGGQVMGTRGTQLDFEPGAFIYDDGTPVTGQVQVSLVEVLSVSEMILFNIQTVGNDNGNLRMLRSGGAINVYANQGSTPVQITNGGLIAKIPTDIGDPSMDLFSGNINSDGNMIWDRIDSAIVSVDSAYYDTTDYTYTFPYYFNYNFNPESNSNWNNCDFWWDYPTTTSVQATIPSTYTWYNTQTWIIFPTENASAGMYSNPSLIVTSPQVGVGADAVVVSIYGDSLGVYSSFNPITVAPGMNIPLSYTPTTIAQFEADVNAL
ncbi:MAG: hypothetical protein IPI00_09120 [Flavobacteriales bacterium]|nr:hypothetical protein [Flavobacteriales bacterium]MBK6944122.1 hypothetical protein [Flavobacteriales bacterium]MBK7240325.1 hypothetical protein [Flavobacteriales bacterium]MBK7295384.1 hypothetical protein [Flavobacteriales bacterium]MBP9137077.1 hypothetical protein [Flavobacteriales bacterium]